LFTTDSELRQRLPASFAEETVPEDVGSSPLFYLSTEPYGTMVRIYQFHAADESMRFAASEFERVLLRNSGLQEVQQAVYVYPHAVEGASEIFRLANPQNGDMLYTTSSEERDYYLKQGWRQQPSLGFTQATSSSGTGILLRTTVKLDDGDLSLLSYPVTKDVKLVFNATNPKLAALTPGAILYSEKNSRLPLGLVAMVKSVSIGFLGMMEIETAPARLADAFEEFHIFIDNRPLRFLPSDSGAPQPTALGTPTRQPRSETITPDSVVRLLRPDYLEEAALRGAAQATTQGTWTTTLTYDKKLVDTACCAVSVTGELALSVMGEINTSYSLFPPSYAGEVLFTPVLTGSASATASLTVGLSQDDISLLPDPITATFIVGGIPVAASVDLLAGFGITGSVSETISTQVTLRATGGFSFDLAALSASPIACPNPCPGGFSCGSSYSGGATCSVMASGSASFTTDNSAYVYVKPTVGLGPGLSAFGFSVDAEATLDAKFQLEAKIEPPNLNVYAELIPEVQADLTSGPWTWTPVVVDLDEYSTRIWQIALGSTAAVSVQANPSNGGSVNGGGTFPVNSQRQISATPYSGFQFTGWNDGNTQNPRTVTVPSGGASYTANFQGTLVTPAPPGALSPGASTDSSFPIGTTTPTSTWSASPGADRYGLYISKYPYGSSNLVYVNESISGSQTSFPVPPASLADGGSYRWNMSAHNSAGWGSVSNTLYFQVSLPSPIETISTPALGGPTAGSVGANYTFSVTTSAVSNLGHAIQYQFDWGNGTTSGWLAVGITSASTSWAAAGTYSARVEARSATNTTVLSNPSSVLLVYITGTPSETISVPGTPSGTTNGFTAVAYSYSTSGASSSVGHPLQYQFSFGNGDVTPWMSPGAAANEAWFTPGVYAVTVKARCAIDNQVVSQSSAVLNVTIANATSQETISTINPPTGESVVTTGAGYRYYYAGGGVSSLGHAVQYQFYWGDGTSSGWLPAGTQFADKTWTSQGNVSVTIQARCSIHTSILSAVSTSFPVSVTSPSGSVQTLAGGLSSPLSLAVDTSRVYWTDSGSGRILSIPSDGSTNSPTVLASGMVEPSGIAVDNSSVYFSEGATNSSTIRSVPKGGGTVSTIQSGLTSVFRIATDVNNLYWTDPVGGTIRSVPKSGGASTILASDPGNAPSGIAVDSVNVYWTQMVKPGNVMKVPIAGGTPAYIDYGTNTPGVATDGTFVYWTQYAFADGQIKANYVGQGGQESILVDNLNAPYDLAIDSSSVFWVEETLGNVKQVSIAGGTPVTLASGLANPQAIAVDSSSVYWLEYNYGTAGGGVLRKAPKQAPAPVAHVTVQTTVPGIVCVVDGNTYQNSPQSFDWVPGSTHTLNSSPTQFRPSGGQYQFTSWSDGGTVSHTVSPSVDTTYTAVYATQFSLAVLAYGQGSVTAATGYTNQGQPVAISATPNTGYTFVGWEGSGIGSYSGPLNNVNVTMDDQIVQTANFSECSYALASSSQAFLVAGGIASVSLTVLPGCPWQAASNVPWIGISSGGTGNGSGSVTYSVATNSSGAPQTGTLTIAGLTFTVTQSSASTCSYSATLNSSLFSPTGGLAVGSVAASYPCSWTASSAVSWISIQNGSTGSANGPFSYLVMPNVTGATRLGTITLAGQFFTITQSGTGIAGPLQFQPFHDFAGPSGFKTALGMDGSVFVASPIATGGLQLAKSVDGGATFNPPALITDANARSFDISVDSANVVHIAWWGNGGSDIYYARSTDGGASFGPPLIVRTGSPYGGYTNTNSANPKIASDGLGNVYVAYPGVAKDASGNNHGSPIWISRSTDGGTTFQPEFYANVPDGNVYAVNQLIARDGSLFVLEYDSSNDDIYFYSTTSSTYSHTIIRVNQVLHKAGPQASAAIGLDGTTIYATYVDTGVDPNGDIYFTSSSNGGTTWSLYFRVSDTTNDQRSSPTVLVDASGGLHFLWQDYNQVNQVFYAYSADKGASFSNSANLSASQPPSSFDSPQAMVDQARSILYVFAAKDAGGQGVMTTSVPVPVLLVAKTHAGDFTQGQKGATYSVTVSNASGAGPTNGTLAVTESVPTGMALVSMAGPGWNCPSGGAACTRVDALAGGATYPAITATVNVGASATSPQVNSVSVTGGGSASASGADSTIIQATSTPPATASVTPGSGSGAQQTFALQYADSLGATDLTTVWVWFTSNFNSGSSANSCLAYYARATNQLFLLNDAGTVWSPATPGSAVTLSNSQCSMNAAAASVTSSGTNLTLNLPVTFKAAYAGAKSTYMYAAGSSANSGWQSMGTWTVPAGSAPAPVSVTPGSGSGAQQTFALQYADSLGATDLTTIWVWFTANFNTGSSANSCLVYYARAANQLYLLNNAGTAWSSPAAPGAAVTLSNSQCSTNVAAASVTPSGTGLTLNLPMTFAAAYAGAKSTYMYAAGSSANSGWQSMGSWIVRGTVAVVTTVSVTPTGGSAAQQTFALQYADTLGATDLSAAWVWFTSNFNTVSSANSCIAYYARGTNQILLINDAGTAYTPATPGSAVTLSNSNCSINALTATVVPSGNNLTLNLPVTFAAGFAGAKNIFMFALGSSANSGWQPMGTWTVPLGSSPAPVSVTPVSGSALIQTFAFEYADPLGFADLTNLWVWFTSTFNTVSSANSCIAYYVRTTNQVNLINDAGTAILSSASPGAGVTLSNSQCSINMAAATVVPSGNNLTVNLPVTFTGAYAGAKGIFMYASGSSANSGWQSLGTWTVP
jgi:uncharacterized repeat protein (TIGR02543 family)